MPVAPANPHGGLAVAAPTLIAIAPTPIAFAPTPAAPTPAAAAAVSANRGFVLQTKEPSMLRQMLQRVTSAILKYFQRVFVSTGTMIRFPYSLK